MRPLRALVIYIVAVFVGGALLAPWLYWLVQAAAPDVPKLAEAPFHRFVNRSWILVALAGLWPLFRALGAQSARDLGLVRPTGQAGRLLAGFLLGFGSLAVVATLALAGGGREFRAELALAKGAEKLASAAATAAVVAVLEEVLFRGGIFGGLRRVCDWRWALGWSSGIYALTHFFAPARHEGAVTWLSGLALLPQLLRGFADWQALVPGFFNLTLAGALLALAYHRTGNLYFSIGLHGGWIFWLKSYGALTTGVPGANPWLWGSNRMIDGWLALAVLLAALAACRRLSPGSDKTSAT